MAVLSTLRPKVEVTISVNEEPLREYDFSEESSPITLGENHVIKYIQSIPEVDFAVNFRITGDHTQESTDFKIEVWLDGLLVEERIIFAEEAQSWTNIYSSRYLQNGVWVERMFKFSKIEEGTLLSMH